jgi:hypothetical protein
MSEFDTSNVSSTSLSERTCIRLFGISYHEIISKLVMEAQVLSEVESRLVLLILSESDPKLPKVMCDVSAFLTPHFIYSSNILQVQQIMLGAVVAIEKSGINKESVSLFRQELKSVISIVSKHVRKKCLVPKVYLSAIWHGNFLICSDRIFN